MSEASVRAAGWWPSAAKLTVGCAAQLAQGLTAQLAQGLTAQLAQGLTAQLAQGYGRRRRGPDGMAVQLGVGA